VNSLTEENYLKALYNLTSTKEMVNVKELAEYFNIKMPTVTSMIKKLASKNLVEYESYRPLKLTSIGQRQAALIVRKHRLTEMFLVEKMGIGWEDVHDIAEQIEHIKSHILFDKMDELLDFPISDPHGSPIPDKDGNVRIEKLSRISDYKAGDTLKLKAVLNSSKEFLEYLNSKDIQLEQTINIINVESFDQSMTVSYSNHPNETLSHTVCKKLLVKPIKF